MALVVLLRGVNVGGHRTFRPSALIKQLTHLDAVNIGAAGTFVIRQPVSRTELRAELGRRLSFDTEIMICHGREIVGLMSQNHFADQPVKILARDDRFVFGVYRRQMKAIGYLGKLDRLFGVPATTRNWNTITAVAKVLGHCG